MKQTFIIDDVAHEVEIRHEGGGLLVTVGERTLRVDGRAVAQGVLHLSIDGAPARIHTAASDGARYLAAGARRVIATRGAGPKRARRRDGDGGGLTSPMPGQVLKVLVAPGDAVLKGQTLLIIEAMKMEHAVRAPWDGVVAGVHFAEGAMVTPGAALAEVTPTPTPA